MVTTIFTWTVYNLYKLSCVGGYNFVFCFCLNFCFFYFCLFVCLFVFDKKYGITHWNFSRMRNWLNCVFFFLSFFFSFSFLLLFCYNFLILFFWRRCKSQRALGFFDDGGHNVISNLEFPCNSMKTLISISTLIYSSYRSQGLVYIDSSITFSSITIKKNHI